MPLPKGYVSNAGITVKALTRKFSRMFHQSWPVPGGAAVVAASLNAYKLAVAGPSANSTNTYKAIDGTLDGALVVNKRAKPDYSRNVVITVTHGAAVVAVSGVITGKDIFGDIMTEAWSVVGGGVTQTFTGKKGFAEILSVTVVAVADASTDTVTIGTGNVLGVDLAFSIPSAVKELTDGAVVTTGVFVAGNPVAAADWRGTYAPATVPNGAHTYDIVVICDDPEDS